MAIPTAFAMQGVSADSAKHTSAVKHIVCTGVTKPLPIFSHATVYNGVVYVSSVEGFIPGTLDLASDKPGDQARQVFRNMKTILEQSGSSMNRVLRITIFMKKMSDLPAINAAVNEAFPKNPPARDSLAVNDLPGDNKVVVDAIAAVGKD